MPHFSLAPRSRWARSPQRPSGPAAAPPQAPPSLSCSGPGTRTTRQRQTSAKGQDSAISGVWPAPGMLGSPTPHTEGRKPQQASPSQPRASPRPGSRRGLVNREGPRGDQLTCFKLLRLLRCDFLAILTLVTFCRYFVDMFWSHSTRAVRQQWRVYRGLNRRLGAAPLSSLSRLPVSRSPRSPLCPAKSRAFHSSRPLLAVKPVLLADIGEGMLYPRIHAPLNLQWH